MSLHPLLSFDWISGPSSDRNNVVVMLHGILGQKRNLLSFARGFVSAFPQYAVMLVDLRNHGASQGFKQPHTLMACALDLQELFRAQDIEPRSIIGHSFGAGVTMTFARLYGDFLKSIWLLDAIPALSPEQPRPADPQIEKILNALENCSPCDSKAAFISSLTNRGVSHSIAAWLAMNLVPQNDRLQFQPHPQTAREMLDDFRSQYSLSQIQEADSKLQIFFVQAQNNPSWTDSLIAKIKALSREGNVHLLCLPQSGHWVHIDNPKGVLDMMGQDFA